MRYALYNNEGVCVASTLMEEDSSILKGVSAESILTDNKRYRIGKISGKHGEVLVITDNKDLAKSSQSFRRSAQCVLASLDYIQQLVNSRQINSNKNTARLIHNLTSINAHNIQEIYSLIPQEDLSGKIKGHVEYVRRTIEENPIDAAYAFLRIAKNNAAMKAEFSVFNKLFNPQPEMRPVQHMIHKVLMNVLYLFFSEFTDKNVKISVDHTEAKAYFDYESIHVALYHLVDNAAKYTKTNSNLAITFESDPEYTSVVFKMKSVRVLSQEIDKIYDDGYSGEISQKLGKAGHGIGMGIIRDILTMNGGSINFQNNPESRETEYGIEFESNNIVLKLPTRKAKKVIK